MGKGETAVLQKMGVGYELEGRESCVGLREQMRPSRAVKNKTEGLNERHRERRRERKRHRSP